MNNKDQIYFIAFDVLIETIVNEQKIEENLIHLEDIAEKYDTFYRITDFKKALKNKLELYSNLLIKEDESLFILDSHIPYVIKNGLLITDLEKIEVYIIIQYWINEFKLVEPTIFQKLAVRLGLENTDYENINLFINNKSRLAKKDVFIRIFKEHGLNSEQLEGEWIEKNTPIRIEDDKNSSDSGSNSYLDALFISKIRLFLISINCPVLQLDKSSGILPDSFCVLKPGESIYVKNDFVVNFAGLKKKLIENKFGIKYFLTAKHAESNYSEKKGIKPFNFLGESGELIGLIGQESSGESTILKLLSGFEKPASGSIYINSYELSGHYYQLSGLIGYIGEEDILIPELSVFENLAMSVRLFLGNNDHNNIKLIVDNILNEVGLFEYRNTRVGKRFEKNFHPGQRCLLNIAIELIRDPLILIVDGLSIPLSMNDSSQIINVLTNLTFKGKLIITSITQTNSESFENFDKILLLDKEGNTLYFGDQLNAFNYFMSFLPEGVSRFLNKHKNIDGEVFIKIQETKKICEKEYIIAHKKLVSDKLEEELKKSLLQKIEKRRLQKTISTNRIHLPRLEKQFFSYSIRNIKIKIANKKELAFTLFIAPFLAVLFAFIFRSSETEPYNFSTNPNIPVSFYLNILTSLFLGLIMTANEIFKEKHILKKELYLNISLFSYINAKVIYILIIILLQTFIYTLITDIILSIQGMLIFHWIIYFSTGAFGAILGLFFSSICKDINSISLKIIPFLVIILFLFGCGWIPTSQLNISKGKYTPLISELMISKWAYEAIVVKQFTDNPFQKNYNLVDEEISIGAFNTFNVIPMLREIITKQNPEYHLPDSSKRLLRIVSNRLKLIKSSENIYPFEFTDSLSKGVFTQDIKDEAIDYITYLEYYFNDLYKNGIRKKQIIEDSINTLFGPNTSENLKSRHCNLVIAKIVKNSSSRINMKVYGEEIVQITDPIFSIPINNFGRSQLFQRVKKFNDQYIDTYEFNLSIIWLFILMVYILLITDFFPKMVDRK